MNAAAEFEVLIFDLDGTLIDSSASILAGFQATLEAHKITPKKALTAAIIGPPLRQTLSIISGTDDANLLDSLSKAFKDYYDTEGYKASQPFPGAKEMLEQAFERGTALHLATNKRLLPTELILEHLGWRRLFSSVYALDMHMPVFGDKASMLATLLKERKIPIGLAAYVGDRPEDGQASDANGLAFYAAEWGYSLFHPDTAPAHWIRVKTPGDLAAS